MLPLNNSSITEQQLKDILHGKNGPRIIKFKYNLLDRNENFKKTLLNVLEGEINTSAFAYIKRTARFTMKDDNDINWLNDRVQPFMLVGYEKVTTEVSKSITWSDFAGKKWSDLNG